MSNENAEWRKRILGALHELKSDFRREQRAGLLGTTRAASSGAERAADESGAQEPATAA